MKRIKSIATTLAWCGAAFFTNVAHAGDCGEWVTGGYMQNWTIYVDGIPVHGQDWIATAEYEARDCPPTPVEQEPPAEPPSRAAKIAQALSNFTLACRKPGLTAALYLAEQKVTCTNEVYDAIEADLWGFGPWKWWIKLGIGLQCNTKVEADFAHSYERIFEQVPVCN